MRRFNDWLQRQIVAATEPLMAQTAEELHRSLMHATAAVQQSVQQERATTRADVSELGRDNERTRTELLAALEHIGDELDANHATVRGVLARMRALEVARTSRGGTQVLGGTIDITADDAATPVTTD